MDSKTWDSMTKARRDCVRLPAQPEQLAPFRGDWVEVVTQAARRAGSGWGRPRAGRRATWRYTTHVAGVDQRRTMQATRASSWSEMARGDFPLHL